MYQKAAPFSGYIHFHEETITVSSIALKDLTGSIQFKAKKLFQVLATSFVIWFFLVLLLAEKDTLMVLA